MITTVKPMSVAHARCLAMAYELHKLLGELYDRPEFGPGSPIEDAWDRMDGVIGSLEPEEVWTPDCKGDEVSMIVRRQV